MKLDRRQLLTGSAALGAGWTLPRIGTARAAAPASSRAAAVARVPREHTAAPGQDANAAPVPWLEPTLGQWSLHRMIQSGKLDPLDYPLFAAQTFGFAAVDYVSGFFQDKAGDFAWLRQLKRRAQDAGVANPLILVDGEGALAASDERARSRAIENHVKWLSAAAYLGCGFVRVNLHGDGERGEQQERAADALQRLGKQAKSFGVDVLAENHGGLSSDGAWMAGVVAAAAHPRVGLLPDFGNFRLDDGTYYDRYQGVSEMMPAARFVCAKSHAFDAQGNETGTDYAKMLGIVKAAGFTGWIEIEYEGEGLSEVDGVKATLRLVERVVGSAERAK